MPVQFIDRYKVAPEDIAAAEQWVKAAARRLGLINDKQISAITVYSSDEFWTGEGDDRIINPDILTLSFHFGDHWKEPYLRKIEFDTGGGTDILPVPYVDWQVSETSGDPPPTLEELLERGVGGRNPRLRARAQEFPQFFELYAGIYERLFPQVEHAHLHTDVGSYDEARTNPSHIKKELFRTDLLARVQALRFPPMEVEEISAGGGHGQGGVRVTWEPGGHTNYMIWFNLYIGEDPKVCVYCDPTQSGSTQGWLSTRLIKNENALEKLPYTLEQWANEDLRKKRSPEYLRWRKSVGELLRHGLPRDLEEAWGALRRQLVGVRHEELHSDTGGYDESLMRRLTEGAEDFSFDPHNFEKVVQWAETTGGAVKTEVDEYVDSKDYIIRFNWGGLAGAGITVPGKGGRKYAFYFKLNLMIEVPKEGEINRLGVPGSRIDYTAHIMYRQDSVGQAHSPYSNKILYPTLKEVRESLESYSSMGSVNYAGALFKYSAIAFNKGVKDTGKFLFQKLDKLYTEAVGLLTSGPEHHELHGDVSGYDESLLRRLDERETPPNWVQLKPEEINELKPGEEVSVNYHGRISPAKWQGWFRLSEYPYEAYGRVIQPVAAELLSDPNWDPKDTEAEHCYKIRDIGKEVSVEHEEMHSDVGGYDESITRFPLIENFSGEQIREIADAWTAKGRKYTCNYETGPKASYMDFEKLSAGVDYYLDWVVDAQRAHLGLIRDNPDDPYYQLIVVQGFPASLDFSAIEIEEEYRRFIPELQILWREFRDLVKPPGHEELHTELGGYDEAFLAALPEQFKLNEGMAFGAFDNLPPDIKDKMKAIIQADFDRYRQSGSTPHLGYTHALIQAMHHTGAYPRLPTETLEEIESMLRQERQTCLELYQREPENAANLERYYALHKALT